MGGGPRDVSPRLAGRSTRQTRGSGAARDSEEVVQHVEVIVEEPILHRGEIGDRHPLHRRRVVVGPHLGQLAVAEVEVVRNDATSEDTVARVMATLRLGGKRPVLVRQDIPGFIANRIQHALAREAISLLEKGVASAEDIDEVVKWSLGIRLALSGPLEQRDMNGIDVHYAIASYLYKDLENRTEPSDLLKSKVENGQLGAKSGQGFYTWSAERRERVLREKSATLGELAAWLNAKAGDS